MTNKDLQETLEAIRKQQEEFKGSPQKAKDFLVRSGILTPAGVPAEPYRQDA